MGYNGRAHRHHGGEEFDGSRWNDLHYTNAASARRGRWLNLRRTGGREGAPMLPDWLERLRRSEVVDRVNNDSRSVAGTVLGIDRGEAMRDAAGWGQADFDELWGNLSSEDRVLLYAHFLQLGHLEELIEAFGQLFGPSERSEEPRGSSERPENPIVVDLGCGPFTGGLAIASQFPRDARMDYIGVDRSTAMRRFGERLASVAANNGELPRIRRHWAADVASVSWPPAPSWRPVIVIVSYLLASPTLDVLALVPDLDYLLAKLGRGSVTVLYTNSVRHDANRSFPLFRTMLRERGFDLVRDDKGAIDIERGQDVKSRSLRYALFHRPTQGTLQLG